MPISSIQFRETVGKYQRRNILPIRKKVQSLYLKDSIEPFNITTVAVNSIIPLNTPTNFSHKNFNKICINDQSAVKTSLIFLMFLTQIGALSAEFCNENSNISNTLATEKSQELTTSFPINQSISSNEFSHVKENIDVSTPSSINFNSKLQQKKAKKLYHWLEEKGILGQESLETITKEKIITYVMEFFFLDSSHIITLARKILCISQPHPKQVIESLSLTQSETIINSWILTTLLQESPTEYITKIIARNSNSENVLIKDLIHFLSLEELEKEKVISFKELSEKAKSYVEKIWNLSLEKELPFMYLYYKDASIGNISIRDIEFSNLCTASSYLSQFNNFASFNVSHIDSDTLFIINDNFLDYFNTSEISTIGKNMWQDALNEGISLTTEFYFSLSSLLFEAQNHPQKFIEAENFNKISEAAIIHQLRYYQLEEEINNSIQATLISFNESLKKWNEMGEDERNINNEQYQELIGKIKDYFSKLDEYLLFASINSISSCEKKFISSPGTIISPITVTKKRKNIHMQFTPYYGLQCFDKNYKFQSCNVMEPKRITLNQTDLFSVSLGNEERIYAVKNNYNRYDIFRVDRNLNKYKKHDILDSEEIQKGIIINNQEIKVSNKVFRFYFNKEKNYVTEKNSLEELIHFIRNKHSDELYLSLYEAGNHPSIIKKVWNTIKHFIPLYDCVDGILDKDIEKTIPSCLIDAFIITPAMRSLPLIKTSLSTKGISASGILFGKNYISFIRSTNFLTTRKDFSFANKLTKIQKTRGYKIKILPEELKKYTDKLIKSLKQKQSTLPLGEKINSLLSTKKLINSAETSSSYLDSYITARIPNSEVRVIVRKVGEQEGQDIYTIFDPHTNEIGMGRFTIKENNELVLLESAKLSVSQSLGKIITEDMYVKDIDIYGLSEPDYLGLQWDSKHIKSYLKYKNEWLEIKKINHQLFLVSDKHLIPLVIQDYKLKPEGILDRILRLRSKGFAGDNLTYKKVISNKLNLSEEEVEEFLSKYKFTPTSELYTPENFALSIQETGKIPSWAEAYKVLNGIEYNRRFYNSNLESNGLYSFTGGEGYVYRADSTPPEIVTQRGFFPTEDYGALEKMIPGEELGITVAGDLKGVLRYNQWAHSPFIYKIKLENVRGVSLQDNLMTNRRNLKIFLGGDPEETYETIDSLAEETNGAIYLDEIHLYYRSVKPEDISLVEPQELKNLAEDPFEAGPWLNYQ